MISFFSSFHVVIVPLQSVLLFFFLKNLHSSSIQAFSIQQQQPTRRIHSGVVKKVVNGRSWRLGVLSSSSISLSLSSLSSSSIAISSSSQEDVVSRGQRYSIESVVRRYFDGVDKKNPDQIRSCFPTNDDAIVTIRDVFGLNSSERSVHPTSLVDRCMDFVRAHPDCNVRFHYGPVLCYHSSTNDSNDNSSSSADEDYYWVFAHWYETGTWSGISCDLEPNNQPMAVEGQTRFRVVKRIVDDDNDSNDNDDDENIYNIVEIVVTRTFTEWEKQLIQKQQQEQQ